MLGNGLYKSLEDMLELVIILWDEKATCLVDLLSVFTHFFREASCKHVVNIKNKPDYDVVFGDHA